MTMREKAGLILALAVGTLAGVGAALANSDGAEHDVAS